MQFALQNNIDFNDNSFIKLFYVSFLQGFVKIVVASIWKHALLNRKLNMKVKALAVTESAHFLWESLAPPLLHSSKVKLSATKYHLL